MRALVLLLLTACAPSNSISWTVYTPDETFTASVSVDAGMECDYGDEPCSWFYAPTDDRLGSISGYTIEGDTYVAVGGWPTDVVWWVTVTDEDASYSETLECEETRYTVSADCRVSFAADCFGVDLDLSVSGEMPLPEGC